MAPSYGGGPDFRIPAATVNDVQRCSFLDHGSLRERRIESSMPGDQPDHNAGDSPGTVCHFGTFSTQQAYSRNRSIAQALRASGWHVIECRDDSTMSATERVSAFRSPLALARSGGRIFGQWSRLRRMHRDIAEYDTLLVGYPAHVDARLAARLANQRRRPLVVDAMIGLYDTVVRDRALVSEKHPLARIVRAWERSVFRRAALILVDTEEHARSIAQDYDLPPERVAAIPVGIDETLWQPSPMPPPGETLTVAFWTTFIPLHGVETVARAAKIVEESNSSVRFNIVGDGQTADAFDRMLSELKPANVSWKRAFVPIEELVELARQSDVCLGIMGTSAKAAHVVPYKVYQALASSRPVITADTPAARSVLEHEQSALLVPPGDAEALAGAISKLAANPDLRERLATGGRRAYEQHLSQSVLQQRLDQAFRRLVRGANSAQERRT